MAWLRSTSSSNTAERAGPQEVTFELARSIRSGMVGMGLAVKSRGGWAGIAAVELIAVIQHLDMFSDVTSGGPRDTVTLAIRGGGRSVGTITPVLAI